MVDSPSSEDRPRLPSDLFSILKRSRKLKQELLGGREGGESVTLSITDSCWSRRKVKKKKNTKVSKVRDSFIMNQRILIFFFQASLRNCINCVHCDNNFFIFWTSIAGKKPFSWLKYRKLDLYRLRRYSTWNRARLCCIRKSWSKVKLIGRILSAQNSNFYFLDTLSLESWSGWGRNNPRAIYSFEWSQFKFLEACGSLHSYALIGRLQKSGKHKLFMISISFSEMWYDSRLLYTLAENWNKII